MESALEHTANYYRRDLWDRQEHYVEIWIEKDALAGVLYPITAKWHVPLMVSKGFSSLTYLYEAAEAIKAPTSRLISTTSATATHPACISTVRSSVTYGTLHRR